MTTIDPERQKKAKQYARISRRLWLVDTTFARGFCCGLALLRLDNYSPQLAGWLYYQSVADFASLCISLWRNLFCIDLPLGYYEGFVLPHRFSQSTQSFKDWVLDQLKGIAIGAPIGLIVLEMLYTFLHAFSDTWWLWAAGALLIFNVLLSGPSTGSHHAALQ